MVTRRRKEAIEYIEGQLTYGYIDLGFHDQDELSIIEEALELLKVEEYEQKQNAVNE